MRMKSYYEMSLSFLVHMNFKHEEFAIHCTVWPKVWGPTKSHILQHIYRKYQSCLIL